MEEITQLTPHQLQTLLSEHPDTVLLDVREDNEVAFCHLPGHIHIPMNLIPLRHNELPDDRLIAVYCHHGVRSLSAAAILDGAGIPALSLAGGIDAWSHHIDASVARY